MPERLREARGGASDALVGRFRFFLLIVRTLSGSATICGSENESGRARCVRSVRSNTQRGEGRTISLSSPNLKLSWTTWSSYL